MEKRKEGMVAGVGHHLPADTRGRGSAVFTTDFGN
jgi:hypothetical protein